MLDAGWGYSWVASSFSLLRTAMRPAELVEAKNASAVTNVKTMIAIASVVVDIVVSVTTMIIKTMNDEKKAAVLIARENPVYSISSSSFCTVISVIFDIIESFQSRNELQAIVRATLLYSCLERRYVYILA